MSKNNTRVILTRKQHEENSESLHDTLKILKESNNELAFSLAQERRLIAKTNAAANTLAFKKQTLEKALIDMVEIAILALNTDRGSYLAKSIYQKIHPIACNSLTMRVLSPEKIAAKVASALDELKLAMRERSYSDAEDNNEADGN